MTENTMLDLNAMVNETLDSVPDAPDFANPPAGEYTLEVKDCKIDKYKNKEGADAQRLKILYSIVTTHSTASGEAPVPDGTMFTETFQATEQGLSYFKARIKSVMNASELTGVSLGDMMSSVKGQSFNCRITIKKSPNPNGGEYENVQIRVTQPKQ